MEIRWEKLSACPLCRSCEIVETMKAEDFVAGLGTTSLYKCRCCEVSFTNPKPIDEDIPKMYESQNFGMDLATRGWLPFLLKTTKLKLYTNKLLRKIDGKNLRVLDAGCGDALLAWQFSKDPRTCTVTAADYLNTKPAIIAKDKGEKLRYVPYAELFSEFSGSFDLILLRHVLEHTSDPKEFIEKFTKLLAKDGVLIVEVPNHDSLWRRMFSKYYNQLLLPFHLIHFNRMSFRNNFANAYSLQIDRANLPVLGPSLAISMGGKVSNIGLVALAFYPLQLLIDALTFSSAAMLITMKRLSTK